LLLPGERITKETIDYLTAINKAGGILQGWSAGIDVVKLSSISESTD
jgi:arginine/lysine/ornithine decarboxylase